MPDKPLLWAGSALNDLRAFPADARRESGFQLRRVQRGLMPADFKAVARVGQGVYEIRIHTDLELARKRLAEVLRQRPSS